MDTTTTTTSNAQASGAEQRRVDKLLAHYELSHRNATNEAIHCVAIPLIILSLLGLLYAIHPWVAYAVVVGSLVYYARLSAVFLVAMAAVSAISLVIVRAMGPHVLAISAAIFVLAWIAQFVGHKIEGRKPSFFEDLQYLLVGPLFVLAVFFRKLGWRW
jgi:uncharacterized membrane protein YGL010W